VLTLTLTAPIDQARAGDFGANTCAPDPSVEPNSQLQVIQGTLQVSCNPNSSNIDTSSWLNMPDGTPCTHDEWVAATVTLSPDRSTATITYLDPRYGEVISRTVPGSEVGTVFDMPAAGEQEIFFFPFGSGLVPATFQHGVCTGRYQPSICPRLVRLDTGQPWPFPSCMVPEPVPIGGTISTTTIHNLAINIKQQLTRRYALGIPQSLPSTQGLVNVPSCFWLTGDTAPLDQWLKLVLIAPGANSTSIIYTLVIHVTAPGVDWHFDDPADPNDSVAPLPAECSGTGASTAHSYRARSDNGHQADATFHVTATQTYSIQAWLYWIDFFGSSSAPVQLSPDDSTLTLSSQPYHLPVIQEEGVPIA
jgi:hypothetical protein